MAYRKTEKILAGIEARKAGIMAAAIDLISRNGLDGFTTDAIAARAELAVGLIYKYFPDKTELLAAVVAQLLARDLAAIREAGNLPGGIRAWMQRVAANHRLMATIGAVPAYRAGIRAELAKMIRSAGGESPAILAAVAYGAVIEAAGSLRPRDEATLTTALLKAMGLRVRITA
jgi:AcrR family transcriptional regulator